MSRVSLSIIVVLSLLLLIAATFDVKQYARNNSPQPVSMIELSQPSNQISPKWIAIADPNQKTVSIVYVGLASASSSTTATVEAVTRYDKVKK